MAMLRINTVVVPVADGSLKISHREVAGQTMRSAGTRMMPDRIALRRSFAFTTPPLTPTAATNLKALVHSTGSPTLSVDGDAVEGILSCFGVVDRMQTQPLWVGSTFYADARVLSITLDER